MTLLAAYNFDETSGAILDVSGNGLDIPIASPAIRTPSGHTNNGLTQTGTGIFTAPAGHLISLKTPNRTLMAWVRETAATIAWVLEFYSSSIDSGTWGILFLNNLWQIQARNATGFVRASVSRPTDGLYHHIAGTYDGANVRLYLDGVLVATQPMTPPLRSDADVFRFQDQSGTNISIDDVRFYDEALDQTAIQILMNTPVSADRSGKPLIWTGSAWIPRPAKIWTGSAWEVHPIKGYDGTDWVTSK
jgi:hypothetical protein